jgi:hypothetical protein
MSKISGRRKNGNHADSPGIFASVKANRALVVLGILALMTLAWAAIANRRSANISSTSTTTMPPGTPPPMPANAPAREYIHAGSALISTVEPFRDPPNDLAVWRPSNGTFYVLNSAGQWTSYQWGVSTDKPAPGDFDGDGKTDFCVFRPSTGTWYIVYSSNGSVQYDYYGMTGDKPVPSDFDGDGRSDVAVWRSSNQTWYIHRSSDAGYTQYTYTNRLAGDIPAPGDYDNDGKTDYAVWRGSTATFWVKRSTDGQETSASIGLNGDEPVVGDYDGDGKTDYAVRRPSDNYWRIRYSGSSGSDDAIVWGLSGDIAVPGRYNDSLDTDSKTDIAVWRPSTGVWYIRRSSDGSMRATQWGMCPPGACDIPVPAAWRR